MTFSTKIGGSQPGNLGSISSFGSGLTSSGGTVSVSPGPFAAVYGTGADGDVVISSGTTTLTREMHYSNLTINGTGQLNTAGFRVFVSGTLDISAMPLGGIFVSANVGNNAVGATGGALTLTTGANTLGMPGSHAGGGPGGTGGTGAGSAGTGNVVVNALGGATAAAGTGGTGNGGANAGGAGAAFSNAVQVKPFLLPFDAGKGWWLTRATITYAGLQGGGGGSGGGDGTNAGGGGGSGGEGGGMIYLTAQIINRGTNSTASIIQAKGALAGNGANGVGGNAGGGGGGAGGGGGFVYILAGQLLGTQIANAVDVRGGTSGNGGNGVGTGVGGGIAAGGSSGGYQLDVLQPPSRTLVLVPNAVAGSAGTAPSGTTGGTGGAGGIARGAL